MKKLQLLAAMGLICLSATQSRAASREFNDLLYFEGVWDCEGRARDAASNTLHDVSSIYTVKSTLGESWLQATIFESQDNLSIQVKSRMIGYDTTWKRYVSYEAGQQGAWGFLATADSWTSKMHWTGYLHNFQGQLAQEVEESVRRVSQDAFNWVSHIKTASGEWTTLYDGSCHRQVN
jgi:hypothetical protein